MANPVGKQVYNTTRGSFHVENGNIELRHSHESFDVLFSQIRGGDDLHKKLSKMIIKASADIMEFQRHMRANRPAEQMTHLYEAIAEDRLIVAICTKGLERILPPNYEEIPSKHLIDLDEEPVQVSIRPRQNGRPQAAQDEESEIQAAIRLSLQDESKKDG